MSLTIAQAYDDLRRKLGVMTGETSPAGVDADVVSAMNWALQTMWKAGADYFTRESISVTLVAGQTNYPLATTTQAVLGPVKTAAGHLLRKIEDFGDVPNFGLLYLGQTGSTLANGAPLAYHVRNSRVDAPNPQLVTLYVVPAPDAAAVTAHSPLAVDGVNVCKTYTVADIALTTPVQVAAGYAESLFLPLARLQITRSHLFSQAENLERIQTDAAMAMRTLGIEPGEKPDGGRVKQ